ncbi:MAG: UDP-N-acetylmuramoyl-L-alanyl-D-glutamate--2,6-diaminopimelate ligase, partial [Lapillicoccus sp.]
SVAAQIYGRPAEHLALVGITGTNGKTTTAYLVESGLRHLGVTAGLIGTVETRLGTRRLPSARTTPEATDLHAIFAMMLEEGSTAAVMEVSSHALSQHRVDGATFDVALFTNLSQDHLDFHPTMEDYFAAKALLFTPEHARRGLVCIDDEWGARLAKEAGVPVETLTSHAEVDADWTVRQGVWPHFTLEGQVGRLALQCHLPGEFNVVNTAMAAVTLLMLGHDLRAVTAAMVEEPVVPGRMQRVTASAAADADPRGIVDYAHTPIAVAAALQALRPTTAGRLVVVLGAGGDRDRGKRRAMGAAAARWADDVIVTDDNPRSEDPAVIRAELEAGAEFAAEAELQSGADPEAGAWAGSPGATGRATLENVGGRSAAIGRAVEIARAAIPARDNTVIVLGKGHETGQEVAGTVHAFDDREALRAAFDGVPYRPGEVR